MDAWEQVRDEWSKAEQMGFQAVLQAAKVGQMLIELKAQCPQRSGLLSFEARFKTEMPDVSAKTRSTLMTLARNQSLIEEKKPESQRAALKMISEETKPEGDDVEKKKTWAVIAFEEGILTVGSGGSCASAQKALDEIAPGVRKSGDELRIRAACKALKDKREGKTLDDKYAEHKTEVATLPETAKQKFERLIKREVDLLNESFKIQVRKEFERSMPERLAEVEAQSQRLTREIKKYQVMRDGIGLFMTEEDYKLILGVCHPDREAEKERKEKAFIIMRKLDAYFEAVKAN